MNEEHQVTPLLWWDYKICQWQWWWAWQWDPSVDMTWHCGKHVHTEEPKSLLILKYCQDSSNALGHSSMLMFHVGVNNTTGNGFTQIKSYCKDLEWGGEGVRSSGGCSVNSAGQRSSLRDRCDMEINMSVNRWCCQQNVSCLDHGIMFCKPYGTKKSCTSLTPVYWFIETGSQNPPDWYELFCP